MRLKKQIMTNFTRSVWRPSLCIRPENERDLAQYIAEIGSRKILARGAGLSYSDSCLNTDEILIDTNLLNHLISFDANAGLVVCQGGVRLSSLLALSDELTLAVIPGTIHATVAGAIAHDVHGKNNTHEKSFGHHIQWIELLVGNQLIHCSEQDNAAIFHATIAGLGLTGVITRVALRLKKASPYVHVTRQQYTDLSSLCNAMTNHINDDYQVAWLDLHGLIPKAILSCANHTTQTPKHIKRKSALQIPKTPLCLVSSIGMKLFNNVFFRSQNKEEILSLVEFNNPLDKVAHWNHLYGPKGLIQFQAVFDKDKAERVLMHVHSLIKKHHATPTIAVLKLFNHEGNGLLSFCQPGFTLAIDFVCNNKAKMVISQMNQYIADIKGRVYLAKDLLLTREQYQTMYPNHEEFSKIVHAQPSNIQSDLSKRLGITL